MASNQKGSTVELRTFEKYDNGAVLGRKIEVIDGKKMVTFVWCKLCAKHKAAILSNPLCKGSAKTGVEAYINGTNFVYSYTFMDTFKETKNRPPDFTEESDRPPAC